MSLSDFLCFRTSAVGERAKRQHRGAWFAMLLLLSSLAGQGTATGQTAPIDVDLAEVGDPTWRPVDFHLISAPLEPFDPVLFETLGSLLPPPEHELHGDLGVGPGDAHAPPYDTELEQGISGAGFSDQTIFTLEEFFSPNGFYLTWMTVPDPGATGSSPDFESGPIIPNELFPIEYDGDLLREGVVVDPEFDGEVPPLDAALDPPFSVDGHSHFPLFMIGGGAFLPPGTPLAGGYAMEVTVRDQEGNGWNISVPFQVVPEPSTLTLVFVLAIAIGGIRRMGRRC